MQASPQQQLVYDWVLNGSGNAYIPAVAGAGKTTTLINALRLMKGSVAFAAYNKKIADEIQSRLASLGIPAGGAIRAGTFHSFGYSAWRRVAPEVKLSEHKTDRLLREARVPETFHPFTKQAVSLAKQRAIGVLSRFDDAVAWDDLVAHFELEDMLSEGEAKPTDLDAMVTEAIYHSQKVLKLAAERCNEAIDFDDMIWAPLVHNTKVWMNQWVLVDEAQDTNPARRALAKKMLLPGGRMVAVGDPHQAIYGFTGADNDSLSTIAREFGCVELPLTVSFRCPRAVVNHARNWVSHIQPAPEANEGLVTEVSAVEFEKITPRATDVVLCRNTKPLVELAYGYLRKGVPCHVEGRELGKGLLVLAGKWKVRRLDVLSEKLDDYLERETQRLMAKGQEAKVGMLADKVETLKVIMSGLPGTATLVDLSQRINSLFQDSAGQKVLSLTLSTIHKSKGREWDRVYLYGRNVYMPSKYARQDWQLEQENNLCYVAVTRAKQELVEVQV